METMHVYQYLSSFARPNGFRLTDWELLKKKAQRIWANFLADISWRDSLDVPCAEFYFMLLNEEGELIVPIQNLCFHETPYNHSAADSLAQQGDSLVEEGYYEDARAFFEAARICDPLNPNHWVRLAMVYQLEADYKRAIDILVEAGERLPAHTSIHLALGEVYLDLEWCDAAIQAFNRCLAIDAELSRAWALRGEAFRQSGRYHDAFADLTIALESNPSALDVQLNLGLTYEGLEQGSEAYKIYQQILTVDPFHADALYFRGLLRLDLFDDVKQGMQDVELAAALGNPNALDYLRNRYAPENNHGFILN